MSNGELLARTVESALDQTLGVGEWDNTHEEAFAAGVELARTQLDELRAENAALRAEIERIGGREK
jgi:hypothetical protein